MANLRKVSPGDAMRIPASAYNAFVDAAADMRARTGRTDIAASSRSAPLPSGVILAKNQSKDPVEPYRAVDIHGRLSSYEEVYSPDLSKPPPAIYVGAFDITGVPFFEDTAMWRYYSDRMRVGIALDRIEPGSVGRCVIQGHAIARVVVERSTDRSCVLLNGERTLRTFPLGGIPIVHFYDSPVKGSEIWAMVDLGPQIPRTITARIGSGVPMPDHPGRWLYPWEEVVLDENLDYVSVRPNEDRGTGIGLGFLPNESYSEDALATMAINRYEAHHGQLPTTGAGRWADGADRRGLVRVGPVYNLPGVAHDNPLTLPERSLTARLVPIPKGVIVDLACERTKDGKFRWTFSATSMAQLVDHGDGNRHFNLVAQV